VKRFEVYFMYIYEDGVMKPIKYFLERGRGGRIRGI
jgi:predicted DNA-binding antitoxin AbrB/MazE fold protein